MLKSEPIQVEVKPNKEKTINKITPLDVVKKHQNIELMNEVEIILPLNFNKNITNHLINSFELSIYKKEIKNISLNINRYLGLKDLRTNQANKSPQLPLENLE